jgi:hypothetical protein
MAPKVTQLVKTPTEIQRENEIFHARKTPQPTTSDETCGSFTSLFIVVLCFQTCQTFQTCRTFETCRTFLYLWVQWELGNGLGQQVLGVELGVELGMGLGMGLKL